MAYGSISLEKRLKDNIKDYSLSSLLDTVRMGNHLLTMTVSYKNLKAGQSM